MKSPLLFKEPVATSLELPHLVIGPVEALLECDGVVQQRQRGRQLAPPRAARGHVHLGGAVAVQRFSRL